MAAASPPPTPAPKKVTRQTPPLQEPEEQAPPQGDEADFEEEEGREAEASVLQGYRELTEEEEELLARLLYTKHPGTLVFTSTFPADARADYLSALWYARTFLQDPDNPEQNWLTDLIYTDMALRVSVDGLGRRQYIQAVTGKGIEPAPRRRFHFRNPLKREPQPG